MCESTGWLALIPPLHLNEFKKKMNLRDSHFALLLDRFLHFYPNWQQFLTAYFFLDFSTLSQLHRKTSIKNNGPHYVIYHNIEKRFFKGVFLGFVFDFSIPLQTGPNFSCASCHQLFYRYKYFLKYNPIFCLQNPKLIVTVKVTNCKQLGLRLHDKCAPLFRKVR